METLSELADRFAKSERGAGNILDDESVLAQAIAAASFYAGYASIDSVDSDAMFIDGDTKISLSEWAIIRPLFILYVERESAIQLEASRGLGVDVFGRSTSEIASEITMLESDLPRKAFSQPIITI